MKTFVIDRFEGAYAVLEGEDGAMLNVRAAELPAGLREGDVLREQGGGYTLDERETAARREKIKKQLEDLFLH